MYCHQGHRLYVESVRAHRLYSIHRAAKMPWDKHQLQPQEFCQVTNVRYLVGPPTLCSITLALVRSSPSQQDSEGESGEDGQEAGTSASKERVTFSFK